MFNRCDLYLPAGSAMGLCIAIVAGVVLHIPMSAVGSVSCVTDCDCVELVCRWSKGNGAIQTEYDPDICRIIASPSAYSGTPDNDFAGQLRGVHIDESRTCPCSEIDGGDPAGIEQIGIGPIDGNWIMATYT